MTTPGTAGGKARAGPSGLRAAFCFLFDLLVSHPFLAAADLDLALALRVRQPFRAAFERALERRRLT